MKKWLLIGLGALAVLALIILVRGALSPAEHTATISVQVPAPPDSVWQIISDIEAQPQWVPMVKSVERLPDNAGRPAYREDFDGFEAMTVVTESVAPTRLVKEILPTGPFFGTWTWELAPGGTGTRLVITERGTIPNPFIRGLYSLFADNTQSLRDYSEALLNRIG